MATKGKPKLNIINPETVYNDIMSCVYNELGNMGFNKYGIDDSNPKKQRIISHNQLNYIFKRVYINLFKPQKPLYNNQKSLIDYDNIELLQNIADAFIDICNMLNKSLGLMSFSFMTGINYKTIYNDLHENNGRELNLARMQIYKNIQEAHKAAQVALLNESPVGALAVANNDVETGLQWGEKQTAAAAANTVFILPSERLKTLGIKADAVPGLPST